MVLDVTRASDTDIVNEIDQLFSQIYTLKRHLNARRSLTISRLPPEILLGIFSLIVEDWGSRLSWNIRWFDRMEHYIYAPSYTWLPRITHVCSQWRDIALQSPMLWRHVIVSRRNSLRIMLKRSQGVPISVYSYIQTEYGDMKPQRRIGRLLTPHLHRIQLLQIVSADPYHEIHEVALPGPLPSIQRITVLMANAGGHMLDAELDDLCHGKLFYHWIDENHNDLHSLSLARISAVGIELAIRPSLRHLSIHTLPPSIDMSGLLALLKQTPILESLSLFDSVPPVPIEVMELMELMDPEEIVTLPFLRSLHVRSQGMALTNFLRHISYPAITSMHIDFGEHRTEDIVPGILGHNFGEKLPKNLQYMSLSVDLDFREFRMYGWTDGGPDLDLTAECHSAPYKVFMPYENFEDCQITCWIFGTMVEKVITENLEVFHFNIGRTKNTDKETWDTLYEAINTQAINVHTFHVSSMHRLPHILPLPDDVYWWPREGDDDSWYRPPTQLPSLKYLWMGRLKERDIKVLNDILRKRKEDVGSMLEWLSIPRDDDGVYEETAELVGHLDIRK